MRILVVLVVGAPEEGTNTASTFDCAIRQVQCYNHLPVDFGLEADNMGCEGFGMLCILLETISGSVLLCSIETHSTLTSIVEKLTAQLQGVVSAAQKRPVPIVSIYVLCNSRRITCLSV